MMKRTLALTALAAVLATAPAMAAGGEKGDWELGLFAGWGLLDDYQGKAPTALDPEDDLLYGGRVGYFFTPRISLEGSFQMLATETDLNPGPQTDVDLDSIRLNVLWNFRAGERVRPFVTAGLGQETTDAGALDEDDLGINVGGGVRWFLSERFGLRLDGRIVSTDVGGVIDDRQTDFETAIGVLWAFGGSEPRDSDGDGVPDRRDDCPDTPSGATVDEKGCPKDSDGDGVYDGLDACPGTAAGVPVDRRGCPKDSDGDGVHDGKDACPDTPKGATVDARGCPKDSDGDGVYDGLDACPDTPKGAKVDRKGCPKDSDGDGVYDGLDRCPGTPSGAKVDATGCRILFKKEKKTLVLEGVNFEFNSAKLTPVSKTVLDRVAGSLTDWPEIRVEVAGHTDSIGSEAYNRKLSQKRAESVRDYLVAAGIAASRFEAKGYGESRPVADNGTKEGRDRNRRVELRKIDG